MALLYEGTQWDFAKLDRVYKACEEVALGEMGLDIYPNQIEVVSSEGMINAYSSDGVPLIYPHWSFGKRFVRETARYQQGNPLAYEIVLNSNPCINYIMEDNTMTMQTLVIAHAAFGHNHFFKNNSNFRQFTDAAGIIDYLEFAKKYVARCEDRYGRPAVERILDAAHSLKGQGVDHYTRRQRRLGEEQARLAARARHAEEDINPIWSTLPTRTSQTSEAIDAAAMVKRMELPEDNVLYFIEKNSPKLKGWEAELVRIVRKVRQYFNPQGAMKVANEGCLVSGSLIDTDQGLIAIEDVVSERVNANVWDGDTQRRIYDWFEHAPKRRIKLTLDNGMVIHGGADHKILISNQWLNLDDAVIGSNVVLQPGDGRFPDTAPALPPCGKGRTLTQPEITALTGIKGGYYTSVVGGRHKCSPDRLEAFSRYKSLYNTHVKGNMRGTKVTLKKTPEYMNSDLAYFLGVLIGDGNTSFRSRAVSIVSCDEEMLSKWSNIAQELFGIEPVRLILPTKQRVFLYSTDLIKWLRDNLQIKVGYAAPIKEIPQAILRSPREVVASFLRGLFDADGCATKIKGGCVVYVSRSWKLVSVVQQILMKFDILSRVKQAKDLCYRLSIFGEEAARFSREIGFGLTRKQSQIEKSCAQSIWRKARATECHVVSKEEDFGATYDFSVSDTHRYQANGLIHHNCATFTHMEIMTRLNDTGQISDGSYLEFLMSHSNVVYQNNYGKHFHGWNPYALGFAICTDIKRMCLEPTSEDLAWFPGFAGNNDPYGTLRTAWEDHRDDGFIQNYMSPRVMRDMRMFHVSDHTTNSTMVVEDIHDEQGYRRVRRQLAHNYDPGRLHPQINITAVDLMGDRRLVLTHEVREGHRLHNPNTKAVLRNLHTLWGYPVRMVEVDAQDGKELGHLDYDG